MVETVSSALTPMVATARTIKQRHPEAKIVFVGPCAAKKLEASRRSVRSDVDFVITFEELDAIFTAKGIDMETYDAEEPIHDATGTGRGYAVAGGVANAIENCINEYYPGTEVYIEHAEGLSDCQKMLLMAKAGKKDGCLIEGMGCPVAVLPVLVRILRYRKRRRLCASLLRIQQLHCHRKNIQKLICRKVK